MDFFQPGIITEPLVEDPLVGTIVFHLEHEIIEPVEKIHITLADGPGQRFVGKGFTQMKDFPFASLDESDGIVGQIVDEGVYFAVDQLEYAFLLGLIRYVGGVANFAFNRLLAGGAEFGAHRVLGVIEIAVAVDGALMPLIHQDRLTDNM